MQPCVQCNNPPFKHPQTGKVYKLCAVCGLKAIARLLNLEIDENGKLIEADRELGEILSVKTFTGEADPGPRRPVPGSPRV